MKCPHCTKVLFIPSVVSRYAERYGSGTNAIKCEKCNKIVDVYAEAVVKVTVLGK